MQALARIMEGKASPAGHSPFENPNLRRAETLFPFGTGMTLELP